MRQLLYVNLLNHQKISKYNEHDDLQNFLLLFVFFNEKLVSNKFKKSLSVDKLKRQHILRYRTITDIRITFHIMTFDNGIK